MTIRRAAAFQERRLRLVERGYRGVFLGFDWLIMPRAAAGLLEGVKLGR